MSDVPPDNQSQVQFAPLPQNNSLFASNGMDGFGVGGVASASLNDMYGSSNLGGSSTADQTHDTAAENLT